MSREERHQQRQEALWAEAVKQAQLEQSCVKPKSSPEFPKPEKKALTRDEREKQKQEALWAEAVKASKLKDAQEKAAESASKSSPSVSPPSSPKAESREERRKQREEALWMEAVNMSKLQAEEGQQNVNKEKSGSGNASSPSAQKKRPASSCSGSDGGKKPRVEFPPEIVLDLSNKWQKTNKVTVLSSPGLTLLLTKIRDARTAMNDFQHYADRLASMVSEEVLGFLAASHPITVQTPCGQYSGLAMPQGAELVGVSVVRSGNIFLEAFRKASKCSTGHILIQRHPETKLPELFYSKLPATNNKTVVLLDPMLGTGGSADCAIKVLCEAGVKPVNIVCAFLLGCPEGLNVLTKRWPDVRIIIAAVDPCMNENMYLNPGCGDFGDRYYGTLH